MSADECLAFAGIVIIAIGFVTVMLVRNDEQ